MSNRLGFTVQKLVKPPFDNYVGKPFMVPGSFWPKVPKTVENIMYKVIVLEVNLYKKGISSPKIPRFKTYLVPDDDPGLTTNEDMTEGVNFWHVEHAAFSKFYFEHEERVAAEKAVADAAAKEAEAKAAEDAPTPTSSQLKADHIEMLFKKTPGVRIDKKGNWYMCLDPRCPKHKDPYFVGTGTHRF